MFREISYLLAIVLALFLGVAGHDFVAPDGNASATSTARTTTAVEFKDAVGVSRHVPQIWYGRSRLSPLLNVDLRSELSFTSTPSGTLAVSSTVGTDKLEATGVQTAWADGVTKVSWKGESDYEFVLCDDEASGRLYVSRNRARYLVLLATGPARQVPTTSIERLAQSFIGVAQEGWGLLRPRMIGLLVSYALVAGLFYVIYWSLLKSRLVHRKIQAELPKKGSVLFEMRHSFVAIVAVAFFSYGLVWAVESGHTKLYRDVAEYGWGYWFFSLAMLLVLVDTYVYWTHRLMHHRLLFKYFHKIHHHSYRPTPWATFSVNVNEIIVNAMFMPMIVLVMPVHQNTTIVFALVSIIKNVMNHVGYEIFPRGSNRGLLKWIVSPTYHEMHHTRFDRNFGAYFTWWDKWMGTEHAQYDETFQQVRGRLATSSR